MKKLATWKILLIFTFSPFCTSMLFTVCLYFVLPEILNDVPGPWYYRVYFTTMMQMMFGSMALMLFFIPALLTGIVYVNLNHINRLTQEVICSLMGLLFSSYMLFIALATSTGIPFFYILSILGLLTAFIISFLLNRYQKKPYHRKTKELAKN